MSYGNNFEIFEELWNNLSPKTYDDEGQAVFLRHGVGIVGSCERHEIYKYYMTCALFTYMLRGNPLHWCATLPEKSIHSFHHLIAEIESAFNHFDHKEMNKEILKSWKAPNESIEQFHIHFCNIASRFPEDEIDW